MKLESKKVVFSADQQAVFDYLRDLNNFQELLPADKIENWSSDKDACQFKIKGAADISFKVAQENAPSEISLVNGDKSPFPFELKIFINEKDGQIEAYNVFDGQVNAFLKMMIEKPLGNLFNYVAEQVEKKFK